MSNPLAVELRKARAAAYAFESIARQYQALAYRMRDGHFYHTMRGRIRELDALLKRQQERHGFAVTGKPIEPPAPSPGSTP